MTVKSPEKDDKTPSKGRKRSKPRKRKIHVEESLRVAKGDFDFIEKVDYLEFGAGTCAEGHPIRYGYIFESASDGEQVVLGGTCQWKVYLFRQWSNLKAEQITKKLEDIGRLLWTIDSNALWQEVNEVMARDGADLYGSNLEDAELRNANLEGIDFKGANLEGTILEGKQS
jgi:hypothetical protein